MTVFKNISVLDYDFQPPESPIRKEVLEKLCEMFELVLTSNALQSAVIQGAVGTRKTELIKRFSDLFKKCAFEHGIDFQFEFINCRRRNTNSAMMMKILNRFRPNFRDLGYSVNKMLKMLSRDLEDHRTQLIVVLDEADILIEKGGSKLIYQLSTFNDKGMLSLILISQKNLPEILDPALLNTFKRENVIHLNKFTREEILTILNQRVKMAFHKDIVEMGVTELISDIASEWGDARYALELIEKAGMLANENNEQKVTVEHVRMAKAEIYSTITESKLKALDVHQKLILLAVSRCLRVKAYTTIDEVERSYNEVCKELNEEQLIHSQFLEGINELGMCGIIGLREGKGETVISVYDIPAVVLEDKILDFIAK